jgi:hypothetical protein
MFPNIRPLNLLYCAQSSRNQCMRAIAKNQDAETKEHLPSVSVKDVISADVVLVPALLLNDPNP